MAQILTYPTRRLCLETAFRHKRLATIVARKDCILSQETNTNGLWRFTSLYDAVN